MVVGIASAHAPPALGQSAEICNGIDDDGDGEVDEPGTPPDGVSTTIDPITGAQFSAPCGSAEGTCRWGRWTCVEGAAICLGGVEPSPEICDGLDNDCDGVSDEGPDGGPMPACLVDPCEQCPARTVLDEAGGVICGPANLAESDVATVQCSCLDTPRHCGSACEDLACPPGHRCVGSLGIATCVPETNCYYFGCFEGQACHRAACVDDPCSPNPCRPGEVCKPGPEFTTARCLPSCAGVHCDAAERCQDGVCVATGCPDPCDDGEMCDTRGSCIPSPCPPNGRCSLGAYCNPQTATCGDRPCEAVVCPEDQSCIEGQCVFADPPRWRDAGSLRDNPSEPKDAAEGSASNDASAEATQPSDASASNDRIVDASPPPTESAPPPSTVRMATDGPGAAKGGDAGKLTRLGAASQGCRCELPRSGGRRGGSGIWAVAVTAIGALRRGSSRSSPSVTGS